MSRAWLASLFVILLMTVARSDDLQPIQLLDAQLAAVFNSGDSARIAQMYTTDAIIMPPGGKMAMGRDAVEQYWKTAAHTVTDTKLTAVDVKSLSETVSQEVGSFTARSRGARPQAVAGKFVILWRKTDKDWQVAVDIWNANN
jgi:ketosteroid isomerase-like protein